MESLGTWIVFIDISNSKYDKGSTRRELFIFVECVDVECLNL